MSGGSYDYLCFRDASDVFSRLGNLQAMADRLDEICPEAAAETRALFEGPRSLYAELDARLARLTDLWHDVEWRDSNDYGDDQVTEAVEKFRAQGPFPGALVEEVARSLAIRRLAMQAVDFLAEAERLGMRAWMLPPAQAVPSITCPRCGRTSYNPNDVRERYCGACHQYHDAMSGPPP